MLRLFYVVPDDDDLADAFVCAMSSSDAVDHWKDFYKVLDGKLEVIEMPAVPHQTTIVGVIPWDTLKTEEVTL